MPCTLKSQKMEKKELNPPKFAYEPIDFTNRKLWLYSIDGFTGKPDNSNWALCAIGLAVVLISAIALTF